MRVAIIHEWLEAYAGSERVLEHMIKCFPNADIFAVVDFIKPDDRGFLQSRPVRTSFIQRMPFAKQCFRAYLPLMPVAMEQFDLSSYDLILSSSHAVAKGVLTGPNQVHVSYVHSPMRYAWDQHAQYLQQAKIHRGLKSAYIRWVLHRMRIWDARTANGVDHFLANSSFIATRIHKVYRRTAVVLHPPVDIEFFRPGGDRDEVYVIAARFVPYKRVDLIVHAFAAMQHRRLPVIGTGPEEQRIREAANGAANIEFMEPQPRDMLARIFQNARAFIFGGEEDFGITMVEAQACGTPVIALGRGGALDIVRDGVTGVLFHDQIVSAVVEAVDRFETIEDSITSAACRMNANRFSAQSFKTGLLDAVDGAMRKNGVARFAELESYMVQQAVPG